MAKNFRDIENLKKMLKASKDAKEREMYIKKIKQLQKDSVRTSKVRGDTFTTKGKPTGGSKTGKAFKMPSGGKLAKWTKPGQVTSKVVDVVGGKPLVKAAGRDLIPRAAGALVAKETGKKAASLLGRGVVGGLTAGVGEMLIPNDIDPSSETAANLAQMRAYAQTPEGQQDIEAGSETIQRLAQGEELLEPPPGQSLLTPEQRDEIMRKETKMVATQILDNKEGQQITKEAIEQAGTGMTAPQKQVFKKAIDSGEAKELIRIGEEKQTAGVPQSPKEGFMSALAMFLPTLIGGLVGSITEGSAGLAAGLQGGMQGMKFGADLAQTFAQTEALQAKAQAEGLPDVSKKQQTGFVDKAGRPITFDPQTREFKDVDGNVVTKDFVDPVTTRQSKQLERRDKKLRMEQTKLDHGIAKDAQLSDTQVKRLEDLTAVESSIQRIDELKNEVGTGIIDAPFQDLQEFADKAPEKFTELKAETSSALAIYVKSISGAQVNEAEFKRLSNVLPKMTDAPGVFEAKLKAFSRIVKANKSSFRKAITVGQPLRKGSLVGLDKALKEISALEKGSKKDAKPVPKKQTFKPTPIIPSDSDIDSMSAEQLKKYLGGE